VSDDDCDGEAAPNCLVGNVCGCADGPGQCATDSDNDGLSDDEEEAIGTDPEDADSDDDGVPDGTEPLPGTDSDGDGLVNALDADSDNDGLFDGTEFGFDCEGEGLDEDAGRCRADADGGATTTDPLNADTDGGGVSDGSEDANLDGAIDPGESNPNNAVDDDQNVDSDGDGLGDALEDFLGSDPDDADSDDDGVPDGLEPNPSEDTDGDGDVNVLDADSDDDGLFDGTELGFDCEDADTDANRGTCVPDADDETTTSPLLSDTDRGGVSDGDEDANKNGRIDAGETDPNDPSDDTTPPAAGGAGGEGGFAGAPLQPEGGARGSEEGSLEGGGCSCRTAPAKSGALWLALSLASAAAAIGRRRRRR
jgi:MYXO-CTERM domain-containing protein